MCKPEHPPIEQSKLVDEAPGIQTREFSKNEPQLPASTKSRIGIRQGLFLLATMFQMAAVNSNFAVVAPFFPLHAQYIGMDSSDVAIVFSSYALAQLVIAPLSGALASRFGRKRILVFGAGSISVSTCLFGLVEGMLPGSPLKVWSFVYSLLRVVQGGGAALATTCIFAILTDAFPNDKGKVIGVANSMSGVGWAIGPPVGGLIYAAGGFTMPFLVMGPLPMLLLLLQLLSYPQLSADATSDPKLTEHLEFSESFRRTRQLVTRPLLLTVAVAVAHMSKWTLFDVMFTPWATSEFGINVTTVSLYFSIPAMAFLVISPLGGWVVDRVTHKKWLLLAGMCLGGCAMLCFYQLPWLLSWPVEEREMAMITYLIFEGIVGALTISPTLLPDMIDSAASTADCVTDEQQQDVQQPTPVPAKQDEHTTNLVTSIATTSFNLGGVVGPQLNYLILPAIGVRDTFTLIGVLLILLGATLLTYLVLTSRSSRQYITLAQNTKEVVKPQQPTTIGSTQEDSVPLQSVKDILF